MAEIEINSSLINSEEFRFVKQSLIEASEKDGKTDYRVKTLEYINDSCENNDDMFFYDMMEFIRFLDPSDPESANHIAYTTPNMLIYFNMPNSHIKNARQWDFVHDHECLHQLWETFEVIEQLKKEGVEYNHKLLNIASDCVINHYLRDIRHKECSDGLVTPELLKEQFDVTYDYKTDTQYSLYIKLLNAYKEMKSAFEKFLKEHPELTEESEQQGSGSNSGSGSRSNSGSNSESGSGNNSRSSSEENGNESADDAAKRAQDAADKAKDKANKSGSSEDADNAQKAQGAADKAKDASEKAKNATNTKDKDSATKEAKDAADEAERLANGDSGESADDAAKRAQDAADKAKDKAAKSGSSEDAENAKKAQDAADKAKDAAKKANNATNDKDKDAATKEAKDAADEAEKAAGDGDSSSESSSKKPGNSDGNNITEDEDLEKIKNQAKSIIEKYRKKIAGDFGEFIAKCKSSMTLNPSGLKVETQGRGAAGWATKMKSYVNGFVKKKIFQKKREFEPTYKRMNKRQGVVHAGDTIKKGKRVKKNGLTINAAFYVDRSGSMSGEPIKNVWTSCYSICESLKKQFKSDKVVEDITFKMHAFDHKMHELKFGKRMSADGGTMPFHEILSYISKNTKDYMINIIITDAQFDINESEVKNFIKDIDGMILFITNEDNDTMKDLSKLYSTKLFYILADAKFTI